MYQTSRLSKIIAVAIALLLVFQVGAVDVHAAEKTVAGSKTVDANSKAGKDGAEVKPGDTITYKISYTNNTDEKGTVTITDTIGKGLSFVEATDKGSLSSGKVTWKIADVESKASGSVKVTVKVSDSAEGTVGNSATVKIGDGKEVSTGAPSNKVKKADAPKVEPETKAPETEAPVPETKAPETKAPETEAPAPETKAPETEAPAEETKATETEKATDKKDEQKKQDKKDDKKDTSRNTDKKQTENVKDEKKTVSNTSETTNTPKESDKDTNNETNKANEHEHRFGDWKVVKAATCQKEGSEERVCQEKDCEEKETRAIPVDEKAHNFGDWETTKAATCKDKGTATRKCQEEGCKEVETKELPIDKNAHNYGSWKITEATCTKAGSKERVCSICGDKQTETIPATGHSFGEWKVTKKATCTADGEEVQTCKNCDAKNTKAIPKTGHSWQSYYTVDKAPTKTKEGTKSIHCNNCNETKDSKKIAATGDHKITGIKANATYKLNEKITFTVDGIGMGITDPAKGEVRYVPSGWTVDSTSNTWNKAPYTASFTINKAGSYKLKVTYIKEVYNGTAWEATKDADTTEISFKISTTNVNSSTKKIPKTGDQAPLFILVAVLIVAAGVLVFTQIKRKNRK